MSDFINVTNEVAKATLADPTSAALAAGKSLLADGIVYESDGVNWDAVTTGDFTAATLPDSATLANGTTVVVGGEALTNGSSPLYLTQCVKSATMFSESQANQRAAYDDSTCFTEQWSNLTSWTGATADSMQVSAGKVFSTGKGGASGMCHALNAGTTGYFRIVTSINLAAQTIVGGGIMAGVSSAAAGSAPASGGGDAFAIYLRKNTNTVQQMLNGVATNVTNTTIPAVGLYTVTIVGDSNFITITARKTSGVGYEYRARIARGSFSCNNVYIFNSDNDLLAGSSIGPLGVRLTSTQTVTPRAGIESVGQTVIWTGDGTNNFRIALPSTYDSRKPSPAIMAFHGNGSDETHFGDHGQGNGVTSALNDAGYIVISACKIGKTMTWGNSEAIAAYKAALKYLLTNYSVSRLAVFANSMGGIESFNTIQQGGIGVPVAWVGTAPTANLRACYENALFTSVIKSAYGIASDGSDYEEKTAGYDPVLRGPSQLNGVPMLFLPPTDDVTVPPVDNSYPMMDLCSLVSGSVSKIDGITGGHSFVQTTYNSQIVAFFDMWCK